MSLISHTNTGKTTLARTLVGRDVGEVKDEQHVTPAATAYELQSSVQGDRLVLWDTPGFGDSVRLNRRLAQQGNPVGWFLSEVWDRFRDRAFHLAQHAVRNVRDESDVVLYLVNSAESPEHVGYLDAELCILDWIGKPAILLLNQTGAPRPRAEEAAAEGRWHDAVRGHSNVRAVATLDAYTRCWVQELGLFDLVADALAPERRPAMRRLAVAWEARRHATFEASMAALAAPIALAASDREALPQTGVGGVLRDLGRRLGVGKGGTAAAQARAVGAMATRLDTAIRDSTDALIAMHGLDGHARGEVLERMAHAARIDAPIDEGKAALMGGVVSGALTGLAADLAAGGMTFGAGLVTGAVFGALGGAGIARGMNVTRGREGSVVRWNDAFLIGLGRSALLRYLAVAHFGRGRGSFAEREYPSHWLPLADAVVMQHRKALIELLGTRTNDSRPEELVPPITRWLVAAARDLLDRLYPGALLAACNRRISA
ncbi:MAG: DUF3482 domain-containing protein [Casimicrobiaceae bacterium]